MEYWVTPWIFREKAEGKYRWRDIRSAEGSINLINSSIWPWNRTWNPAKDAIEEKIRREVWFDMQSDHTKPQGLWRYFTILAAGFLFLCRCCEEARFAVFIWLSDLRLSSMAFLCTVIEVDQYVGTVYNAVHDCCHNESCSDIKHRVLFDEYGWHNNGYAQYKRTCTDYFMFCQMPASHNCNMAAQWVIYVYTRPKVGRRIRFIEHGHQGCKYIVPRHDGRS